MYTGDGIPRRWRNRTANILSAYRFIGLVTAFIEIQFITPAWEVSPTVLVIITGVYTLFKVLHPTRWHRAGPLGILLLGCDLFLCAFMVMLTGGVYSPFLLYTLSPVLEAALFMDSQITVTVAGVTAAYVMFSHIWNPFVRRAAISDRYRPPVHLYFGGLSFGGPALPDQCKFTPAFTVGEYAAGKADAVPGAS